MIAEGSVTDMKHWINVFQEDSYTRKQVTRKIIVVMMIFSTSLNNNMSIQNSSLKKKLRLQALSLSLFFLGTLRSSGHSPSLLCPITTLPKHGSYM